MPTTHPLWEMPPQPVSTANMAPLAVTCFGLKINELPFCIAKDIFKALFVDDLAICFRGRSLDTIERHLQQAVNAIQEWATRNGFRFAAHKCKVVHFTAPRFRAQRPLIVRIRNTLLVLTEMRVDQLAKETLNQDIDPLASVHYTDVKPLVNSYIQKLIQTKWDVAVHSRDLYLVKPTLGPPIKIQHLTRAEEVVITRLRIGHTKATKYICVRFCWVPGHCGIKGNEIVDQLAKESLDHDIDPLTTVHYADLKALVNSYIQQVQIK